MAWKNTVGLFSAGVVAGVLALALVQGVGQHHESGERAGKESSAAVEAINQVSALRAEYDRRISVLSKENQALREQATASQNIPEQSLPPPNLPLPHSLQDLIQQKKVAAKGRDTENLLAAGFSMDRIAYLRRRAVELLTQYRQSNTDRLNRGLPMLDPAKELAFTFDPDIGLRDEIGAAEYERYLTALKRPITVKVGEVLKGSVADSFGIKVGDEIVAYDNTRVFNQGDLDRISQLKGHDEPGVRALVTVRRDGQQIQLSVPGGMFGIRQPPPDMRGRMGVGSL